MNLSSSNTFNPQCHNNNRAANILEDVWVVRIDAMHNVLKFPGANPEGWGWGGKECVASNPPSIDPLFTVGAGAYEPPN